MSTRAEDEEATACEERRRIGSLAHLYRVAVFVERRLIGLAPADLAGGDVDGGDDFLRILPAVNEREAATDDGRGVALAHFDLPCRSERCGPFHRGLAGDEHRRAAGTAPFGPALVRLWLGERRGRQKKNREPAQRVHVGFIRHPAAVPGRKTSVKRL